MDDLAAFARLLDALRPWLDHLIIVGGWAHRLHRFTPLAGAPGYRPVTTRDADLAFGAQPSLTGDIATALKAAGFEQELSGDDIPPVTSYRLGGDDQEFFAEFLTPLMGDGTRRTGHANATMRTAGITAQKLRHLDLLLASPVDAFVVTRDGRSSSRACRREGRQPRQLPRAEAPHSRKAEDRQTGTRRAVRPRHPGAVRWPTGGLFFRVFVGSSRVGSR